jgi:hypothetical protein
MSNPEPDRSLPQDDDNPFALSSSPYQPPAMIEDDEERKLDWDAEPVKAMPFAIPLLFAGLASGLTVGTMALGIVDSYDYSAFLLVLASPIALLAGFVLVCIWWYGANPLVIPRSVAWKVAMTTLIPPVSLLIFIPTCVGSTIFIMPSMAGSVLTMALPIGIAYFATALVISLRLRRRFHVRKSAEQ